MDSVSLKQTIVSKDSNVVDTKQISSSTSNLSCEDSNIVNLIDEYDDNDGNEEA